MKKSGKMLFNLVLLTCSTLTVRFIEMGMNVYISGKIGAAGMGLYSLAMSVGGFAVTVALSGVNLASTRLVAAALGRGSGREAARVMRCCIAYALLFGLMAGAGLYLLAEPISRDILKDARCISLLRAFSVMLVFMSLTAALAGYFAAVSRVIKNAVSSLFEQFLRVGTTVFLMGSRFAHNAEGACLCVIVGSCVATVGGFLATLIMYLKDKKSHDFGNNTGEGRVTHRVLATALPVAAGTYIRSGLLTVEHLLIPRGLKKRGSSYTSALASYGVLQGMTLPVIFFPQALVGALAALVIPELSQLQARCDECRIRDTVERGLYFTVLFSVCAGGALCGFSPLLGRGIYNSPEAGRLIGALSPLIPIMYLDHAVDGMLKGLGEQIYTMRVNIADSLLSVILVWALVPRLGLYGYIMTIYLMELFNFALSLRRLMRICPIRFSPVKWVLVPLGGIALSSSAAFLAIRLLGRVGDVTAAAVGISLTVAGYFLIMHNAKCKMHN